MAYKMPGGSTNPPTSYHHSPSSVPPFHYSIFDASLSLPSYFLFSNNLLISPYVYKKRYVYQHYHLHVSSSPTTNPSRLSCLDFVFSTTNLLPCGLSGSSDPFFRFVPLPHTHVISCFSHVCILSCLHLRVFVTLSMSVITSNIVVVCRSV